MLVNRSAGGGLSGIMNSAGFILPLADQGAGVVDLTLQRGVGSATFTRATTAWTKLSTGLWASVGSGSARSCYLGATTAVGAYGGYFAEAAGTQLVTPTASIRGMNDASWVKVTMTATLTATGIDGVGNSASRVTATGAVSTILQTLVAAASSRTYSCWMRRVTGSGTILIQQGATTLDVTALINSSTYTRVELNASILNAAFGITINTSGDAIDVDFNQFEAGAFATSPMDAAGAVRNDDVLTYPFAGNALTSVGSCYAEFTTEADLGPFTAVGLGVAGRVHTLQGSQALTFAEIFDSTAFVSKSGLTSIGTGIRKRASAWGGSTMSVTGDGAAPASGAFDGVMGSNANVSIAHDSSIQQLNGMIRNPRLWTTQLSDATLQAITA